MIIYFETKNKLEIVSRFYELESADWHRNIHKNGGTEEENIKDTMSSISPESKMYIVNSGSELAAFFVKYTSPEGCCLEGFHVHKNYRNKVFLSKFWEIVRTVFNGPFYVGICHKNIPAIKHLKKQGFLWVKDVSINGKDFVLLKEETI